jgi:hypothetical protein
MHWARISQTLVRHQACAVLADVYSAALVQGETVLEDVTDALPLVRAAGIAMFAHPAAYPLGSVLAGGTDALFDAPAQATARAFTAASGKPALEITASMPAGYPAPAADYWILTDDAGHVTGFAHFDPLDGHRQISGFVGRVTGEIRAYPWVNGKGPGTGIRLAIGAGGAP